MDKGDFKFTLMDAFEEGYLEEQAAKPPEERDAVKAKFDFSGSFGSGGKQIRAEDIAILRELTYSYLWPVLGRNTGYGSGWDQYVCPVVYGGAVSGYYYWDEPHPPAYLGLPNWELYKADHEYYVGSRLVLAADDETGYAAMNSYTMSDLSPYAVVSGTIVWVLPGPGERPAYPDGLFTSVGAREKAGYSWSAMDCSVHRGDVAVLLYELARSYVRPGATLGPYDSPDPRDFTYGGPLFASGFTDRASDISLVTVSIARRIVPAASRFRVMREADADMLWGELSERPGPGGARLPPAPSRASLGVLYSALSSLSFVRTLPVAFNDDPGRREADSWRDAHWDRQAVLCRFLPGATARRATGDDDLVTECRKTSSDPETWTCSHEYRVTVESDDPVDPESLVFPRSPTDDLRRLRFYRYWRTWARTSVEVSGPSGGTTCAGVEVTELVLGNTRLVTGEGARVEVVLHPGMPRCVTVSAVRLLVGVVAVVGPYRTDAAQPYVPSGGWRTDVVVAPVEVADLVRGEDGGYSGTVAVADIVAAADHGRLAGSGEMLGSAEVRVECAEVEFSLSVPSGPSGR